MFLFLSLTKLNCDYINCDYINLQMEEYLPKTHLQELEYLKKLGFPTNPLNSFATDINQVWKRASELEEKKESLNYPIDGLVVKLNSNFWTEKIGAVGKAPRGWCAIKFKSTEVVTKIIQVTWQVGRTGKVTPVAELETADIAGTQVKRATLHNYKEFLGYELCSQDSIVIRKAGEIIPEVVNVLVNLRKPNSKKFSPPDKCPSCGHKLTLSETSVDLVCKNRLDCPAQIIGRLSYFTSRKIACITGLSDKILEKFSKNYLVKDIPDLYNLPFLEIQKLEGFGEKSVANIQKSVQKARKLTDTKFLAGLSIEGIGVEVAKLILENI